MIWKWDFLKWKMWFRKWEFYWECDFEHVNFLNYVILNMWIFGKMWILSKLVGTPRHLFSVETAIPNASKTAWYLEVLRTPPNTYETNCSSSSEENSHKMAVSSMLTSLSTGRNISLKQANTKELVRCLELSTKKEDEKSR